MGLDSRELRRIAMEKRIALTDEQREQRRKNSEIVETDVEIVSLVDKKSGKCGNQGLIQTMEYNPCRFVMKGKTYLADIQRGGNANVKGLSYNKREGLTLTSKEYVKEAELKKTKTKQIQEGDVELKIRRILKAPLVFLQMGGLSEIQSKIIYGSFIAVAGYFAYKKFKK